LPAEPRQFLDSELPNLDQVLEPCGVDLPLRRGHHARRGVGREHLHTMAPQVDGVLAGAACQLQDAVACRERRQQPMLQWPAQQRADGAVREGVVVAVGELVKGERRRGG